MITEIGFFLIKKIINDSFPKFNLRELFIHSYDRDNDNDQLKSERITKMGLLLPISKFYEIPHFEINDPTMDIDLLNSYFNVAIKVVLDFDLGDKSTIKFHASNFLVHGAQNKNQLLEYLIQESRCPTHNDSRYRLGFRSISKLLNDNIDNIDFKH